MIRWITQNLGTAARDQVGDISAIEIVDVRHMVDKRGNSREAASVAVQEVVALLRQGKRVVVCCDYGMSRSNAVAAGALVVHEKLAFGEAVRLVIRSTGEQEIKTEVLSAIEDAVLPQTEPAPAPTSEQRNRILVTGGSGFIGRHLIERLRREYTVVAPGRSELDIAKGPAELNLLVKEHRINQLVHLASPRVFNSNAAIGPTLVALKNVIDVCQMNRIKVVFVSGWEIYSAYRTQCLLAGESLPANPKGPYGLAKWLCERLLEQERATHATFEYTIARLGPVYGSGSEKPKFLYRYIDLARRGEMIVAHRYLNGLPALDFTYIDDAIMALALVIEKGVGGDFNFGWEWEFPRQPLRKRSSIS